MGSFLRGKLHVVAAWLLLMALSSYCGEPPAPPAVAPYRFSGGERVRLIVPATVGETIEQVISDDGLISLPIGKSINIRGNTIQGAQTLIADVLTRESGAKNVRASLALLEIPPRRVYIGGEVKTPQAIVLTAGISLTLAAALATAGGTTPEGDLSNISVIQPSPDGTWQTLNYDGSQTGRPGSGDLGPVLTPGAVITVPRGDVFILAGEVVKPGVFNRKELSLRHGEPARLSRVLLGSGGLKATANRKDVRLIRTGATGTKEVLNINLDDSLGPIERKRGTKDSEKTSEGRESAEADPVLRDGDIILAGASGGVTILGRVRLPGVYPLGGETLKLTRLIALAGGFNDFAKTSSVTVIRAAAPKSPLRVDVGAITKEGDTTKDLDLEDGDLVFVGERML